MAREPGTYHVKLADAGADKLNNEKQTQYIWMRFDLLHFAVAGEWKPVNGDETCEVRLFLSDKAWPYTEEKLRRFGFNGDFKTPVFNAPLYDANTGLQLSMTIDVRDGKSYEEWQLPRSEVEHKPLESSDVMRLQARWRQSNAPVPAGAPSAPPPAAAPAPTLAPPAPGQGEGDEPPF